MPFAFRAAGPTDSHHLIDIDLKCFEHPLDIDQWRRLASDSIGAVCTFQNTPVGMVLFSRNIDGDVEIDRLAVKRPFRRLGMGSVFVRNCVLHAQDIGAPHVALVVPESSICPGQPGDLTAWLSKLSFKAQVPFLKDHFYFYGEPESGVRFLLPVPFKQD